MAPAQLQSLNALRQFLHKIPQQRRSLYFKALIVAICLLRSRIFVVARPNLLKRRKNQSLGSGDHKSHLSLDDTKDEQLVPVYTVDDDETESVLVSFKGKVSKVSTNFNLETLNSWFT